jgi:uncharacterized membrane protein
MDEQRMQDVPPTTQTGWQQTAPPPPGSAPNYGYAQQAAPAGAEAGGLTDTAAGALAYVTIIPAIIFLVMPPYNTRPFVKFHAFQCLGLAVVMFCLALVNIIPLLGQIVYLICALCMLVIWVLCIIKASQGRAFKLPIISEFASKQSGYQP